MRRENCYCDIILNSITEGVFTVDLDRVMTSFNRAAEKMTGMTAAEVVGKKASDVFCDEDCPIAPVLDRTIRAEKGRKLSRITVRNTRGRKIPLNLSTVPLRDDSGDVVGAAATFRDLSDVEALRREIQHQFTFENIVSANAVLRRIFDILPEIAASDSTVLIEGPSGSGKELFARAIHNLSDRRDGPLVVVNCGSLPDTLLESELFGYRKGAFTDAKRDKPGRFALADGGTIFLDEIGDVSGALQVRLLRVLQEREYEPLGGEGPVKADVRIIAATNRRLADLVARGQFREDLYFRLNVVRIELPPLSERREDIPLLVDHFIQEFNAKTGKSIERVSDEVLDLFMHYEFPGNVRELSNLIEHAFILCRGPVIEADHLPIDFVKRMRAPIPVESRREGKALERSEVAAIRSALERNRGHRGRTAADLGIDPSTLWRKMKRYGIEYPAGG